MLTFSLGWYDFMNNRELFFKWNLLLIIIIDSKVSEQLIGKLIEEKLKNNWKNNWKSN